MAEASTDLDAAELALLCKALGHPVRIRILRHLAESGACFFGNFAEAIDLAPSTVSQHVSILREAGLIRGAANAQRTCYCVQPERLAVLRKLIASL